MCATIDNEGRLTQNSIMNIANIFHTLTYMYPDFDIKKNNGPRINVIFTNFGK